MVIIISSCAAPRCIADKNELTRSESNFVTTCNGLQLSTDSLAEQGLKSGKCAVRENLLVLTTVHQNTL